MLQLSGRNRYNIYKDILRYSAGGRAAFAVAVIAVPRGMGHIAVR